MASTTHSRLVEPFNATLEGRIIPHGGVLVVESVGITPVAIGTTQSHLQVNIIKNVGHHPVANFTVFINDLMTIDTGVFGMWGIGDQEPRYCQENEA